MWNLNFCRLPYMSIYYLANRNEWVNEGVSSDSATVRWQTSSSGYLWQRVSKVMAGSWLRFPKVWLNTLRSFWGNSPLVVTVTSSQIWRWFGSSWDSGQSLIRFMLHEKGTDGRTLCWCWQKTWKSASDLLFQKKKIKLFTALSYFEAVHCDVYIQRSRACSFF